MRRIVAFDCAGDTLVGTLDAAQGTTGLLIVSGGNEIRAGAHRGMALLATKVAAAGHPVFRYDRRGVGDSAGTNGGFLTAADDLGAAVAAFRREAPQVTRVAAFGNCDAASTLALFGRAAGIDTMLLANPWVVEDSDSLPPAAAIRARYVERLLDPRAWGRLVSGRVDLRKLARGIRKIAGPALPSDLAARVTAAIAEWGVRATVLLASRDATAIAFRAAAPGLHAETIDTASHSFARDADRAALESTVMRLLAG